MGLFNFIKNIGKDTQEGSDLKEVLTQAVLKAGLDLKDFNVEKKGDVVNLSGIAGSQKDLELARLIVGNFKGVEKVNDDQLKLAAQQPSTTTTATSPSSSSKEQETRMVAVKPGDTLSKLAEKYLGDPQLYPEIFEANKPMIKDPDEIFPGQVLRIPGHPDHQPSART